MADAFGAPRDGPAPVVHIESSLVDDIRGHELFKGIAPKSLVYTDFMKQMRLDWLTAENDALPPTSTPDALFSISLDGLFVLLDLDPPPHRVTNDKVDQFVEYQMRFNDPSGDQHKRTMLHVAASTGDILAVYELLRWGAQLDVVDAYGDTALMTGLQFMRRLRWLQTRTAIPSQADAQLEWWIMRCMQISGMLVRHHANVNCVSPVGTPLRIVLAMGIWDLVELLLEHGADPVKALETAEFDDTVFDSNTRGRFAMLCQKYAARSRPPRRCPCSSGLPTIACHATGPPKPRPLAFLCFCKSGKSYKDCCSGDGVVWEEFWSPEKNRIVCRRASSPVSSDPARFVTSDYVAAMQQEIPETIMSNMRVVIVELHKYKMVDPAFLYAFEKLGALPETTRVKQPRKVRTTTHEKWNDAVEEYIAGGSDSRPAAKIRAAARVDANGEAQFQRCGSASCKRVEDFPGQLRGCAGCKQARYCDANCQKAAWKVHKKVCKSVSDMTDHLLPSHSRALETYSETVAGKPYREYVMEGMMQHVRGTA
ncbi:hypothetical protein EXIGLDRAFT_837077 [Exidia glandulosa HHB12029]|uniref:protein S-acyltransferase n=1 Tax=Exidia glandulosa HHB12029 TaxID=1314781 RepID=A0A165H629_EXIGL|nr:hypothetical protein EXIGLDRAFT_837077 [Exidia glandulosa HHB12029]